MLFLVSCSSAISTMPTAPATISGPGRDHRLRRLALQHGGSDLRRVREVGDAGLDHLDAGLLQPLLDVVLSCSQTSAAFPRSETSWSSLS